MTESTGPANDDKLTHPLSPEEQQQLEEIRAIQ
jgi:hypothetical protein